MNGTCLIVPTSGYVKDGVLDIPDIVTNIEAIGYLGSKPSKIVIPASMEDAGQILDMTKSKNLTIITKAKKPPKVEGNGYCTVKNLTLYVPEGCKKKYEKKWVAKWKSNSGLKVEEIKIYEK